MPLLRHWLAAASSISDGFDGPPEGDSLKQWINGIVFPVIIAVAGIGFFLARDRSGFAAFVAFLCAFIHFHYFWGLTEAYAGVGVIGKNAAALGMILCLAHGLYVFTFRM